MHTLFSCRIDVKVLREPFQVGRNGDNGLSSQVLDRPDVRVELIRGEERGEVGSVRVGDDEDGKGVGRDDDAGGEGADSEDVDGERVREAVPHALTQPFEDMQLAVFSVECAARAVQVDGRGTRSRFHNSTGIQVLTSHNVPRTLPGQ